MDKTPVWKFAKQQHRENKQQINNKENAIKNKLHIMLPSYSYFFMRYFYSSIIIFCFCISCSNPKYKNPHVEIQTKFGDIEVELYPDKAPKSVAAFLSYVDSGYYKNASFYRALNDDNQPMGNTETALLQGGIWKTKPSIKLAGIPHETTQQTKLTHKNGTISLARQAPGTANTEFFICIGNQKGFDYGGSNNPDGQGYAAFGQVVKGMDLINQFYTQPTDDDMLKQQVEILNIVRL
jgi:peptidyl-prolyl cis-trans isomerase A (cyclophilin A)